MNDVIQQRQGDLNNIEGLMNDIGEIAKDLNMETKAQGEQLARIDQNITETRDNAQAAHKEI